MGQIGYPQKIYPPVKEIKIKDYINNPWDSYTVIYPDEFGRPVREEYYLEGEIIVSTVRIFNEKHEVIASQEINHLDNTNATRTPASFELFEYQYEGSLMTQFKLIHSDGENTTRIIEKLDSNAYCVETTSIYKGIERDSSQYYIQLNSNGQIVEKTEALDLMFEDGVIVSTTTYEYYPNGQVKRRIIEYDEEFNSGPSYCGFHSDDQSWEYKYDKKDRIKYVYTIVNGVRYKSKKYRYKE